MLNPTPIEQPSPLRALFSYGFRPFFLGGVVTAALATPIAAYASVYGFSMVDHIGVFAWHAHELIFGYVAAVVAGFILTAVPNWTRRLPISGRPLALLFLTWMLGRCVMLVSSALPVLLVAGVDCLFLLVLNGVIWREVLTGKNWRNLSVCTLLLLFGASHVFWYISVGDPEQMQMAVRFALGTIVVLLTLIGGRITPSFTRNWLVRSGFKGRPAPASRYDLICLWGGAAVLLYWAIKPEGGEVSAVLIMTAIVHGIRLMRWFDPAIFREPMVLILHVGYGWLVLALFLLGLAAAGPMLFVSKDALHGLTAGAIGVMTLAVMTRASLGHTGHEIKADGWTQAIFLCVNLGAALRVAAFNSPGLTDGLVVLSSLLWSGGFALFLVSYGPKLLEPRRQLGRDT